MVRKLFFILLLIRSGYSFSQSFYDISSIQVIELTFARSDWDTLLDQLKSTTDDYLMADKVKINGVEFDSVGVKFKGNSSYNAGYAKNPFHIELDSYKSQSYMGFKDIKLGNSYSDPSLIREVLSYHILGGYMDVPRCNFARLFINGKYIGLYSNEESINKDFCSNHFGSSGNTFIKCNPILNPGPANKSNLKYISADSSAYQNYYEMKSDNGWNDLVRLCDTLTNFQSSAGNVLDMDKAAWMLAFDNLLVNLDSYMGAFCQNYYLYKDAENRFNPIVWDLNMSFGGFPYAGSPNNGLGSLTVTGMQNLPAAYHSTHTDWPLITTVFNNASYKKRYYAHLRTMLQESFDTGYYVTMFNQFKVLIDSSASVDSNSFFTYSDFNRSLDSSVKNGSYYIPGIRQLMTARISYIKTLSDYSATAPVIVSKAVSDSSPSLNDKVYLTVTLSSSGASFVYLGYRFSAFAHFKEVQMFDDGLHGDGNSGDQVYGAEVTLTGNRMHYYYYAENSLAGVFHPSRAAFTFFVLEVPGSAIPVGALAINEFLADNKDGDINEYGTYSDWIELKNNTSSEIQLAGVGLSDSKGNPYKFTFPAGTVIGANSYLVVWADEMPTSAKYNHTGFKLSSDGEELILQSALGVVLDSLTFGSQTTDVSEGRCPDGTGPFTYLSKPTFKERNVFCPVGLSEYSGLNGEMRIYPNPANSVIRVVCNLNGASELIITDLAGRKILQSSRFDEVDVSSLTSGTYLVQIFGSAGVHLGNQKLIIQD